MADETNHPRISETEWEVMRVLWNEAPLSSSEVVAALQAEDSSWHPKTVKTLLGRLVKKGALDYEQDGRAYLYRPLVTEEQSVGNASDSFLRRVFDNSVGELMVHFARNRKLSKNDIKELKEILKRSEKKK